MSEMTYREAVALALRDEMLADDSVFVLGEDVGAAGGVFKATQGLHEQFGDLRVQDTPISETAIVGAAIGAALMGLRPVAEIMFADFAAVCYDQIVNQLAKYRYMTGGQAVVPVTIRLANGVAGGFGAQHSQAVENWFLNTPGLKLALPSTAADVYTLLRAAIRDADPVLVFEHKGLYQSRSPRPAAGAELEPLGRAEVVRAGTDATVIAAQLMLHRALEAAERLAADGINVEVIDPRTIAPLDLPTILASVRRTSRLACVQESSPRGSWGESIAATVVVEAFDDLDAPPLIIGGDNTPIPYAPPLESAWVPSAEVIERRLREFVEA